MFTGLIEARGKVTGLVAHDQGKRLTISAPFASELQTGESIAVSGVCLTVTGVSGEMFSADVSPETIERTTLGSLAAGQFVNLERALLPTTRLGGHIVSGHVDTRGVIAAVGPMGAYVPVTIRFPARFAPLAVEKGSIAIDGISLTINAVTDETVECLIIPHTRKMTTAEDWKEGMDVNLEFDLIARQIMRLSECYQHLGGRRDMAGRR